MNAQLATARPYTVAILRAEPSFGTDGSQRIIWEQGRRKPEGPAIALLRIAARHPRIIRENLRSAA